MKIGVDAIVNSTNETLVGGEGISGAIHEAAGPELLDECWKLSGCETGQCKVTVGLLVSASYVFHTMWTRNKGDNKQRDCYKSCLQKALAYVTKCVAFRCVATHVHGFHQKKAAEIALATIRHWLESNHYAVDCVVFYGNENANYELYKDLMSTVYFPVSKLHLTGILFVQENSDNDWVVNVKNIGISNEQDQPLLGW